MFVLEVLVSGQTKYLAKPNMLVDDKQKADWFDTYQSAWWAGAEYIDSDGFPDEVQALMIKEV